MPKKAIFVCDGTSRVGFGHFSRCLTIALEMSKHKVDVGFCGEFDGFAMDLLKGSGFNAVPKSSLMGVDLIIADSYLFTKTLLAQLKAQCQRLVVLDDFDMYRHDCVDLLVNFRFNAQAFVKSSSQHVLGIEYFPFKQTFVDIRKAQLSEPPLVEEVKRVLLVLGASDRFNITATLLCALDRALSACTIVVLSAEAPCVTLENNKVIHHTFTKDMDKYYRESDVVISGGGSIKYEAGFCMVPNAAVSQTAEQQADTKLLQGGGICFDVGLAEELLENPSVLETQLQVFLSKATRKKQTQQLAHVYDLNSTRNLVNKILGSRNVSS
ncbi:hypothetical protein L1286_17940 [Pseudoalteromonas sp. SMS1]|uniref:hypothetical protein n=1 Tax=Pseudoalteromonas sp. SMS1 TaxID=2908894 RepID=UPI001F18B4AB|nr:hypothetical protein [Pseudoalteromonas sp. SMS1]MCF2859369.1 hypothetical protein [Pseudoalteromonas sp. SMS1]